MNLNDILHFRISPKNNKANNERANLIRKVIERNRSVIRKDISDWVKARNEAGRVDFPRRRQLMELYDEVLIDTKLSSKIQQRKLLSTGSDWVIVDQEGKVNEEVTTKLTDSTGFADLIDIILDTPYFGHSLVELSISQDGNITTTLLPRTHVVPKMGLMLFESTGDKGVLYRELPCYNITVFEFGRDDNLGLINKAIPYALYKRFATSCWSELCEIYGIPPRYIKTDTTDPANMDRAEQMMRDMGANPWWVIDTSEEFGFVNAVNTNGDLYGNLIRLCNNELATLIAGAVIGEDAENGSRSKEQVGQNMLNDLAAADRVNVGKVINSKIMPALALLGVIPEGMRFQFCADEDLKALWDRVSAAMPYYDFDIEWMNSTFGFSIKASRMKGMSGEELHLSEKNDPFL